MICHRVPNRSWAQSFRISSRQWLTQRNWLWSCLVTQRMKFPWPDFLYWNRRKSLLVPITLLCPLSGEHTIFPLWIQLCSCNPQVGLYGWSRQRVASLDWACTNLVVFLFVLSHLCQATCWMQQACLWGQCASVLTTPRNCTFRTAWLFARLTQQGPHQHLPLLFMRFFSLAFAMLLASSLKHPWLGRSLSFGWGCELL